MTPLTQQYRDYLRSDAWQQLRAQIRQRSGGRCEICHLHPAAHVHHRTYVRFGHEALEDLVDLCLGCHQQQHPGKVLRPPRHVPPAAAEFWALQERLAHKVRSKRGRAIHKQYKAARKERRRLRRLAVAAGRGAEFDRAVQAERTAKQAQRAAFQRRQAAFVTARKREYQEWLKS